MINTIPPIIQILNKIRERPLLYLQSVLIQARSLSFITRPNICFCLRKETQNFISYFWNRNKVPFCVCRIHSDKVILFIKREQSYIFYGLCRTHSNNKVARSYILYIYIYIYIERILTVKPKGKQEPQRVNQKPEKTRGGTQRQAPPDPWQTKP